jgi:type IV pilus assembly protein PilQ
MIGERDFGMGKDGSAFRMRHAMAAAGSALRWCLNLCLLYLLAGGWGLAQAQSNSLDDIKYSKLSGDRIEIKLELAQPPAWKPSSFSVDNPARIALDLPGTRINLPAKNQSINIGIANSISAVEAGGRTRVVLNLTRLVPYTVKVQDNAIVLALGDAKTPAITTEKPAKPATAPVSVATPPKPVAAPPKAQVQAPVASKAAQRIENIDFKRGEAGEARITLTLSDPSIPVDVKEQGGKILIDVTNAALPERLNRRLDVIDFGTPVKEIDTVPQGNGIRMTIAATGVYEHMAYQSDNLYTVEIRPLTKTEEEERKKDKFTGERLSLNFQNIEVRAVLQIIADFTGFNLVANDGVTGNVTLRLKNVPWDQALQIVLKSKGLGMRQDGNVIMVAPQEELTAQEKLELEAQKQIADLSPLRTEFIQINYAKASDIASLVKAEENNLLTKRGSVSVDERTNTLLIQETSEKLAEMRKIIETLDIPVRQVLIESRIVIADQDFSKQLGVKFGYSRTTLAQDKFGYTVGGKREGDTVFFDDATTSFHTDNKENFILSLPTTNLADSAALGLAVGKIGSWLLQLELSALQAEGRGEVISNPRVITADQKEALIEKGVEIPYQLATSSGATAIEFKKAVLGLRVTPHITPDDRIIMDLEVNKDSVGNLFAGVPSINTQNVGTQVLVDNGETVVLGGVYEEENREDVDRVPFLGELPYFGNFFRRTETKRNKGELLIFITPKILKESLSQR